MFADIDADIYVMADGDLTYDPKAAPAMVDLLLADQLDMVVGTRRHEEKDAYRGGHVLGNRLFTGPALRPVRAQLQRHLFGLPRFFAPLCEELPGPLSGFEIETEMSVHALELRMPVGEVETSYGARPEGSQSKLSTYSDGWRILKTIVTLYRVERPVLFYGSIGALLVVAAIVLAIPLVVTYLAHRPRTPLPDGDPGHGHDHHRGALLLRWPHPRHGDARPTRGPAARLSLAQRARVNCSLLASPNGNCVVGMTVTASYTNVR